MPSNDPKQQALRTVKRRFNIGYKNFSQRLKGLKDGINGRASKVGIPASNIKDPLPGEVGTVLEQLASEFAQLVDGAHSIIDEQGMYSQTRRKKQPKHRQQEAPGAAAPGAPEEQPEGGNRLVEQLSRLGQRDEDLGYRRGTEEETLISEASNPFSRAWQYLKSPFLFRDEKGRHRIQLLRLCADMFYRVLDFENAVLTPDIKHMPETINAFQNLRYAFDIAQKSFAVFLDKDKKERKHQKGLADKAREEAAAKEKAEQLVQDEGYRAAGKDPKRERILESLIDLSVKMTIMSTAIGGASIDKLLTIVNMVLKTPSEDTDILWKKYTLIQTKVKELTSGNFWKEMMTAAKRKYGEDKFEGINNNLALIQRLGQAIDEQWPTINGSGSQKTSDNETNELIKLGHNQITRALRRQLIKLIPFNKTAVHRLDIISQLDQVKKELKEVMDVLEKGVDSEKVAAHFETINNLLNDTTSILRIINVMYEQKSFKERKKHKTRFGDEYDPISDFLMRGKLRRDLRKGLY